MENAPQNDEKPDTKKKQKHENDASNQEFRYLFVGDSGSGKTFLALKILKMLKQQKKQAKVILYSPTAAKSDLVKKHDHLFDKVVDELNDDLIEDGLAYLEDAPFKLMIFDDLGEHEYIGKRTSELTKLVINARHEKVHLFFLVQKLTQLNRAIRRNWDVLFLFGTTDLREMRYYREEFLGHMSTQEVKKIFKTSWRSKHDFLRIAKDPPYHQLARKKNENETEKIKTDFSQF